MFHRILPEVSQVFQVRKPRHREVNSPTPITQLESGDSYLGGWAPRARGADLPLLCQAGLSNQESWWWGWRRHTPASPNLPPASGSPAWVSVAAANSAIDKGLWLGAEGRWLREAGSPPCSLPALAPSQIIPPDVYCLSPYLLARLPQNVCQINVIATARL